MDRTFEYSITRELWGSWRPTTSPLRIFARLLWLPLVGSLPWLFVLYLAGFGMEGCAAGLFTFIAMSVLACAWVAHKICRGNRATIAANAPIAVSMSLNDQRFEFTRPNGVFTYTWSKFLGSERRGDAVGLQFENTNNAFILPADLLTPELHDWLTAKVTPQTEVPTVGTPHRDLRKLPLAVAAIIVLALAVRMTRSGPLPDAVPLTVRFIAPAEARSLQVQYCLLPDDSGIKAKYRNTGSDPDFHVVQDVTLQLSLNVPYDKNPVKSILGGQRQYQTLLLKVRENDHSPPRWITVALPKVPTKETLSIDLAEGRTTQ